MIRILVVDDDADLNRAVCTYLNDSGFEVRGCLGANDAYQEMYNKHYDLIVSDIMMPDIDGFEFARTVRRVNGHIPILFMSARDDLPAKQKGFQLGIDDYMGLNPKFCVNSQRGENRSEFNVCGSGFIRLPPCVQYNAGGDGCQGRRQGRRSSERRAAAHRPLTSGPGGVIRACVRQNRWTAARGSRSSPAAVPSTSS